MDINFNSISVGSRAFGIGAESAAEGKSLDGQKAVGQQVDGGFRLSDAHNYDIIAGSEPIADVPANELVRDDGLGRIVASAFNFPPPPMPNFQA